MTDTERWMPIGDFERYEISDCGRVRHTKTGKIRREHITDGYADVTFRVLGEKGVQKTLKIHRLVALAFLPRSAHAVVRHLDGNPLNNVPANLEWGTFQDNSNDMAWHGTVIQGERHYAAKLSPDTVLKIRDLASSGTRQADICRLLSMNKSRVSEIIRRKRWRHL